MNKYTQATRRFRHKLLKKGLCVENCGNSVKQGYVRCEDCLAEQADKARERRLKNKIECRM